MSRMNRYHSEEPTEQMEQANNSLPPKKKLKKKKKIKKKRHFFRRLFFLIILIVLLITGYTVYGYNKGLKSAKNDTSYSQIKVSDFNGQKSSDGSTNILLLGSDSRGEDQGRSDTIIVAHYNKNSKTPQLISFMRDLYVDIPDYGMNKINAAYSYGGPELVRKTLKENFNINVQYYMIVSFTSFPKVIDTLLPDGVEIDAEKDIELDGVSISKGNQKMDGNTLLQYARFRKDEEGDFGRVRRQQQVLTAVEKQAVSLTGLWNLPEAVGQIRGYTTTDLPTSVIASIGKDFILGQTKSLEKLTIPVDDSWSNGYYYDVGSVLEYDSTTNKQALENFLK